jgi:hypothetical protein
MALGCPAQAGVILFVRGRTRICAFGEALGKYDPLRDYLAGYGAGDEVRLTFGEVEEFAGPLPLGARRLRQWWANGSTAQAQAWRAANWHVLLVDMATEQVLFVRSPAGQREPVASDQLAAEPRFPCQGYLSQLHLPLVVALLFLCVIIGTIGFAFRPGTDAPPPVSDQKLLFSVFQENPATATRIDPARVSADEIMIQENSSTVMVQLDLFASFARAGQAQWSVDTAASPSPPYPCPDLNNYLGTAYPNPVSTLNGRLTIGSQTATPPVIADFLGRRDTLTAPDVLGLDGQSPGAVPADVPAPIAEVDLCWTRHPPMAVDGEFTSAALPEVVPEGSSIFPVDVIQSLYFENPLQGFQPITAEYSLQSATSPTSTDPSGWHWSGSQGALLQVTAVNIPVSQHETFLGFVSAVLFGVVGGAVVLVLQEVLEPIRSRRRTRSPAQAKRQRVNRAQSYR